jgi:hypothetical protein
MKHKDNQIITNLIAKNKYFIFFKGKYIINQVSAQEEQRLVKKKLHNRGAVYMRNTKNKHQTKHHIIEVHLLISSLSSNPPDKTPTRPRKFPWTLPSDLEAKVNKHWKPPPNLKLQ